MGKYTVRQSDRVTDRQNDSRTIWQNSRAAKEPALVKIKFTFNSIFYIEMAANFQFQIKIFHLSLIIGLYFMGNVCHKLWRYYI